MASSGAIQNYDLSPWAGGLLASGEESLPRWLSASTAAFISGQVRLTYFTARKTETVNNVRSWSNGTAAIGTTLARQGFYSVAANGDLTLVGACANDTNLWSVTNTAYQSALTAPFSKVQGQRYAAAGVWVGGTGPSLFGLVVLQSAEDAFAPRISGQMTGQADFPATILAANVLATSGMQYYVAMP